MNYEQKRGLEVTEQWAAEFPEIVERYGRSYGSYKNQFGSVCAVGALYYMEATHGSYQDIANIAPQIDRILCKGTADTVTISTVYNMSDSGTPMKEIQDIVLEAITNYKNALADEL